MLYAAPESFSSDINDIVYPPPEPEKNVSDVPDNPDNTYTKDSYESGNTTKKSGITEEIHDRDKINKIYIDRRGNVMVPGTTSFEPVNEKKSKNSNSHDDSGYYQNDNYQNHHHRYHPKPDYRPDPQLSEKKGRTKSKLGITGPGYIFVPAKGN